MTASHPQSLLDSISSSGECESNLSCPVSQPSSQQVLPMFACIPPTPDLFSCTYQSNSAKFSLHTHREIPCATSIQYLRPHNSIKELCEILQPIEFAKQFHTLRSKCVFCWCMLKYLAQSCITNVWTSLKNSMRKRR